MLNNMAKKLISKDGLEAFGNMFKDFFSDKLVCYAVEITAEHIRLSNTTALFNRSFTSQIIVDTGYSISSVSILMGGVDVTSTVYDSSDNTINILLVTGALDIAIVAKKLVTSITLNKSTLNITDTSSETLRVTVIPSDADNTSVIWSSSDSSVAKVSSNGVVVGMGAGTATITCTAADGGGASTQCVVTVTEKQAPAFAELQWMNTMYGIGDNTLSNYNGWAPGCLKYDEKLGKIIFLQCHCISHTTGNYYDHPSQLWAINPYNVLERELLYEFSELKLSSTKYYAPLCFDIYKGEYYVVATAPKKVYKSSDNGTTWETWDIQTPPARDYGLSIIDDVMYIGSDQTSDGTTPDYFISTDWGVTWQNKQFGIYDSYGVVDGTNILEAEPNFCKFNGTVYAGIRRNNGNTGLLAKQTGVDTWEVVGEMPNRNSDIFLFPYRSVLGFVASDRINRILYIGTISEEGTITTSKTINMAAYTLDSEMHTPVYVAGDDWAGVSLMITGGGSTTYRSSMNVILMGYNDISFAKMPVYHVEYATFRGQITAPEFYDTPYYKQAPHTVSSSNPMTQESMWNGKLSSCDDLYIKDNALYLNCANKYDSTSNVTNVIDRKHWQKLEIDAEEYPTLVGRDFVVCTFNGHIAQSDNIGGKIIPTALHLVADAVSNKVMALDASLISGNVTDFENIWYATMQISTFNLKSYGGATASWGAENVQNITFEDQNVKDILIANGISADGENVTNYDAQNINSISTWFKGNTTITSFNELNQFPFVTSLANAFTNCTALTNVSLNNITGTCNQAFNGCTSLTSVSLPALTGVSDTTSMFQGCTSLQFSGINLPNLRVIGSQMFRSCTALTTFESNSVTSIGATAFMGCSNLTSVSFPNATTVGVSAFQSDSKLSSVYMPNVTSIGSDGFRQCNSLENIDVSNVTRLDTRAFYSCIKLKNLDFNNLTSIGNNALNGCNALQYVVIRNTESIPTLVNNGALSGTYPIYVTDALYDTYLADSVWSTVANISTRLKKLSDFETDAVANGWTTE